MELCRARNCNCLNHSIQNLIKDKKNDAAIAKLKNITPLHTSGSTFLHFAVKCKNIEIIDYLVKDGCPIDGCSDDGETPLMIAVRKQLDSCVEILLVNNAEIFVPGNTPTSVLAQAMKVRLREKVTNESVAVSERILEMLFASLNAQYLLSKVRISELLINSNDDLVKFGVIVYGDETLLNVLLDNQHYDINYRESCNNYTVLEYCLALGKIQKATCLLDYISVILEPRSINKSIAFYYIEKCERKDKNCHFLSLFLDKVKRISALETEYFVLHGSLETISTLLKYNIDLEVNYSFNRGILHLLVENSNDNVLEIVDQINFDLDLNSRQNGGDTPLMVATRKACLKKTKFLLEQGANTDIQSDRGENALHYAVAYAPIEQESNVVKIIELLLLHNADTQTLNRQNDNILDIVLKYNRPQCLIENIIIHLAIQDHFNQHFINETTRETIRSNKILTNIFIKHVKIIRNMHNAKLFKQISLYNLLNSNDTYALAYIKKEEFISRFNESTKKYLSYDYYINYIKKNIQRFLLRIDKEGDGVIVLHHLTGIKKKDYGLIMIKILRYLNNDDFDRIVRMKNTFDITY